MRGPVAALLLLLSLVGAWRGGAARLLFELTRPLDNLFLESELQEALEEQESWMKPGQLCAYGSSLDTGS